ncbi:MAG: HAD hydrolase-like protein, partial [Actinomycetota bacterium]|nr:HAD hydrolase-like protein [Actinomycetota bacterium]
MSRLGERNLVLLDLDGTISEPRVGIINGYRAAFEAVDLPTPADEVISAWIGPPLRQAFPQLGIPEDHLELAVAGYRAVYNDTGWLENELYPHMPDVVRSLGTRGPLGLATAKPTGLAT